MHYYIDGYNCLFCLEGIQNNLHLQRTRFLERLRIYVQALNLSVTIVFDSMVQAESTRSHLSPLECIYTNKHETADHHLLSLIQHSRFPSRITLVTSDNALATAARHAGAQTIEAIPFLNWLTQRYAKVKHKQRTQVHQVPSAPSFTKLKPVKTVVASPAVRPPPPKKSPKENLLTVFEERYRTLCQEEVQAEGKPSQRSLGEHKTKTKSILSQKKRNAFHLPHSHSPQAPPPKLPLESETARWQRLFEQNSHIQEDSEDPKVS